MPTGLSEYDLTFVIIDIFQQNLLPSSEWS